MMASLCTTSEEQTNLLVWCNFWLAAKGHSLWLDYILALGAKELAFVLIALALTRSKHN